MSGHPNEPLLTHTRDYWDDYTRRRDILHSRYPGLDERELHYRSLPPAPSKPAPPKPEPTPTLAKRLWPYMSEEK
jgi:hypothetical protein